MPYSETYVKKKSFFTYFCLFLKEVLPTIMEEIFVTYIMFQEKLVCSALMKRVLSLESETLSISLGFATD